MLSIRNIVKQYANHRALDNVSIEVEKGSIFLKSVDCIKKWK